MEDFGTYLKNQREKRGIRLEEIASITKIHLHNLELLENGKLDQLPPEPFLRGFITAYAKYVGLDPKDAIDMYSTCSGIAAEPVSTAVDTSSASVVSSKSADPHTILQNYRSALLPRVGIWSGVAGVLLIGFGLVRLGIENSRTPTTVQTEPVQAQAQEAQNVPNNPGNAILPLNPTLLNTQPTSQPTVAAAPVHLPSSSPTAVQPVNSNTEKNPAVQEPLQNLVAHSIEVETPQRTWMKVVTDNNAPIEFFLSPGKKVQYSAQEKIKVVLGNATGAKVLYNGEEVAGKKFMGTIHSYRYPAQAQFPQDPPKQPQNNSGGEEKSPDSE